MLHTRHVDVGRARLAVHLAGKGPLAVLIHGYPLDHRMWLDVLATPLAERRTLAAIDLRGHGQSPWAGDAIHSMELFADDVAAVVDALGSSDADVVALSMGGYVALALYERHPAKVRTLTLVDTRSGPDTPAARAARQTAMESAVAGGRRAIAEAMLEKLVPAETDLLVRARIATMIEAQPVETIVADLRGLRDRPDRTGVLGGIGVPALVVVGERDVLTPPEEAERMAKALPRAKLVVVPGAGHLVPMEAPAVLVEELGRLWGGG